MFIVKSAHSNISAITRKYCKGSILTGTHYTHFLFSFGVWAQTGQFMFCLFKAHSWKAPFSLADCIRPSWQHPQTENNICRSNACLLRTLVGVSDQVCKQVNSNLSHVDVNLLHVKGWIKNNVIYYTVKTREDDALYVPFKICLLPTATLRLLSQ